MRSWKHFIKLVCGLNHQLVMVIEEIFVIRENPQNNRFPIADEFVIVRS